MLSQQKSGLRMGPQTAPASLGQALAEQAEMRSWWRGKKNKQNYMDKSGDLLMTCSYMWLDVLAENTGINFSPV